ncbi:MAG: hypothetical protein KJ069_23220 [Anaerolineae bacterium]|nr:hypothetical protein [Anaerolineae bacterium]
MLTKKGSLFVLFIVLTLALLTWPKPQAAATALDTPPSMVLDIEPEGDSNPRLFTLMEGKVYFSATTTTHGYELWVTDGTAVGTHMVKNINPYPGGSLDPGPLHLTVFEGMLYFSADDVAHGRELWKSDGTEAGTIMVKDMNANEFHRGNTDASEPYGFVEMNGALYFIADDGSGDGLWKTDGTEAGTVRIGSINAFRKPAVVGNTLFFVGYEPPFYDDELWKSDGTPAGTMIVKDINAGTFSSSPEHLTVVNNTLFFTASDSSIPGQGHGAELWKSDGTEAGTVLVKDIRSGPDGSLAENLTDMNGILYFRANNGVNGIELWRSDGTEANTFMVKDINPGEGWGFPPPIMPGGGFNLPVINNELYFYGSDGINGVELWKSDGTESGTVLIKDIFAGSEGSTPGWFTSNGTTLYYTANDGVYGMELWQSDGTEVGTFMIHEIYPGLNPTGPANLSVQGEWLLFSADDGVHGEELWLLPLPPTSGTEFHYQFLPLVIHAE